MRLADQRGSDIGARPAAFSVKRSASDQRNLDVFSGQVGLAVSVRMSRLSARRPVALRPACGPIRRRC